MDKPAPPRIRVATDRDFDDLRRIGYAGLTYRNIRSQPRGYLEAIKERFWSDEVFAEALVLDENALLVAEDERRVIAFGEFASYNHGEAYIHKLYVTRERQRQRIGSSLVGAYLDRQEFLAKWLRTEVVKGDKAARQFWEKRGYKAGKPFEWDLDGVVVGVVPYNLHRRVKFKSSLSREISSATAATRAEEEARANGGS